MQPSFQNIHHTVSDAEVFKQEVASAKMAEDLGFDSIWAVEHHFSDYSMSPNPLQILSYFAGCTNHIQLGTAVVVLPWNNPLRVAEELSVLDAMTDGRVIFGIGRGIGRVEYDAFSVPMSASRGRFAEAAGMILSAMETGFIEGNGEHFPQPRAEIRPRPLRTFRGRTYAAAVSPESIPVVARLGAGVLVIPQKPWEECEKEHNQYRAVFEELNGRSAPQPIVSAWVFVDEDEEIAHKKGLHYISEYYKSALEHYEFAKPHMKSIPGFEYYGKILQTIEKYGLDQFVRFFCELQVYGTPEQCLNKILHIQKRMNACAFNGHFSRFGDMPRKESDRNIRLFARTVMPALKKLEVGGKPDMSHLYERQAAE
jgi:alkanesulfonate monooxygenase SsuD/methylene tetrahydromethanopterin reductase-like flavin-dependent oxidoreductase (luciferase family)